jgi:hypothetical protein
MKSEELFDRIAGGEQVAGIARKRKSLAKLLDLTDGDGTDCGDKLLVAGLQSITRMKAPGVAGAGGLHPQPAVEFNLQAEELFQR